MRRKCAKQARNRRNRPLQISPRLRQPRKGLHHHTLATRRDAKTSHELPHETRNSRGEVLRNGGQGASIKFISRQVWHSSAKLTLDIYSHLMEGAEVEAMGRLQERLDPTYAPYK